MFARSLSQSLIPFLPRSFIIQSIHHSEPLVLTLCLGVIRHECGSHLESLSFFDLNAVLALLGTSASFGIGHTKDIVGLNATVDTAVAWNGLSESRGNVLRDLNTIENAEGIFIALLFLGLLSSGLNGGLSALESFLFHDFISLIEVDSVELVDSIGRDGL